MATTTNFALETPTPGGYRNTWGGTLNTTITKLDELVALAMPLGTIQMYPLATAPTATTNGGTWLICDGSSLVRTTYPDLHTLITNTYGTYPDGDTFLLPDLRARVPVGYNVSAIGSGVTVRSSRAIAATSGGTEGHIMTEAQLAAHSHAIPTTTHVHAIDDSTHIHTGNASGNTGSTGLTATDSGHTHTITIVDVWGGGSGDNVYAPQKGVSNKPEYPSTASGSASISVSPASHSHSLTTTATSHGVTGANASVIGITATAPDTGSNSSHNNMQPFITIQYIILAKHPSF